MGLATMAGPLLGGLLTEWNILGLSWRAVFLVNVRLCGLYATLTFSTGLDFNLWHGL